METPVYVHPGLREPLQETFGVIVYHEQVIRTLAALAGFSETYADHIRRHLDHQDLLPGFRADFLERAVARNVDPDAAERIWDAVTQFASFGFCKAHAAAFALPTYQSAWLKAHHPAAFLAGVLTHDPGMYPKRLILDDARQFGIEVLPLDVNRSEATYRVERVEAGYGIRLALAEVKGISEAEVARVVAGRPYGSLADFWHRAGVARPVVERLVLTGAFDALYPKGLRAYWKGAFVKDLPDAAIAVHVEHGSQVPEVTCTMHLYPINGACHRVGATDTAFAYRDATYGMVFLAGWTDPAKDSERIKWLRDYYEALSPYSEPGGYINFMQDDDYDRIRDNYRQNYDRLAQVKRAYDPGNLFHMNQNVAP
jgi:hypothetical protein